MSNKKLSKYLFVVACLGNLLLQLSALFFNVPRNLGITLSLLFLLLLLASFFGIRKNK